MLMIRMNREKMLRDAKHMYIDLDMVLTLTIEVPHPQK